MFGRNWKLDWKWDARILRMEKNRTFVGLTFERKEDADWVREKMPWTCGGGLMLVESGQHQVTGRMLNF